MLCLAASSGDVGWVGFIKGCDRREQLFLPPCVDDYVAKDGTVRIVPSYDVFVDELNLTTLGFADAAATGRPGYHPATLLKLYIYGYLNQVQSSRCLEREAGRNVELMWLTGKLAPDINTIADFRREHGLRSRRPVAGSCCCVGSSALSRAARSRWTAAAFAR